MKKLILFSALCLTLSAGAQVTVLKSGQTIIGTPTEDNSSIIMPASETQSDLGQLDPQPPLIPLPTSIDKTASLNIWGISNESGVSNMGKNMGHITFGFGSYASIAGNSATGNLKLSAKRGFTLQLGITETDGLSWGVGTGTIASTYDIKAPSFLTTSDSRMKKNIASLNGSYAGMLDITPVSYNLTKTPIKAAFSDNEVAGVDERGTEASGERLHFGFIAQEIQELYPNLVVEDEDGMLAIDYAGFIPLLVDAYKNLAIKVKEQEETIESLLSQRGPSYLPASVNGVSDVKNSLKQNKPNPFNTTTTIECTLQESVASAVICIYDLQGKQVHRMAIHERGIVNAVLDASSLQPGMYIYTLIADGTEIDSKRMIITD